MKATTLRTLVGVTAPLIVTGAVSAGFTGISTLSKPNPWGILTVNVYADFDRPGEDHMIAVTATPNAPVNIEVIGGTFYHHPFGGDRPPSCALGQCGSFQSLNFDTFVTIGVKSFQGGQQPFDDMVLTNWPGFGDSVLMFTNAAWSVAPDAPQGDPFDPVWAAGDGRVLIGQFSTLDGSAIQGTMLLQYISNNVVGQSIVSFYHVPCPGALWLLGATGLLGSRRRTQMQPRDIEMFEALAGDALTALGYQRQFEVICPTVSADAQQFRSWFEANVASPPASAGTGSSLLKRGTFDPPVAPDTRVWRQTPYCGARVSCPAVDPDGQFGPVTSSRERKDPFAPEGLFWIGGRISLRPAGYSLYNLCRHARHAPFPSNEV